MGDPRPHGGPAEERDGDPQHNHRGPPPEGLGALTGPEEPHHIRRSDKRYGCLFRLLREKSHLLTSQMFPKGTFPKWHLSIPSASLVGPNVPTKFTCGQLKCSCPVSVDLGICRSKDI